MAYSRDREKKTLEIENPLASCGHCRFTSMLAGKWSVEDGRLVFRADPDPQPGRGPDLEGCCEDTECGEFARVTAGDDELTAEQVAALRKTARDEREREMREWAAARG